MPSKLSHSSSFTTTAETIAGRDSFASGGERRMSSGDAGYVSARSADALLSDFRATTLQPQCLVYLNELLDELLSTILQRSMGLTTDKLKTHAITTIIPPPLGRDAVGEAELELLSWMDSADGRQSKGIQEVRYVSSGSDEPGTVWPWREAWELMRVMTQSYSTLGDRPPSDSLEKSFIATLKAQGGDVRPGIIDPAALYLTAILEHVAEYILSSLSRVMGHEQGKSQAGPKELHSALCEDEALYRMVKGMKIKTIIERAISTPRKTSSHPSNTNSPSHRSKNSHSSTSNNPSSFPSNYSLSSIANNSSRPSTVYSTHGSNTNPPPDFGPPSSNGGLVRSSLDSYSSNGPPTSPPPTANSNKHSFSLGRKSTSSSHRNGAGGGGGNMVIETRNSSQSHAYDAAGEEVMDGEGDEEEREFDDFLRGGKTVKLSLTPMSLKAGEGYEKTASASPRRNRSIARRPPPQMDEFPVPTSTSGSGTSSPARPSNGVQPSASSLRNNNVSTKPSFGGGGRLAAREPTARVMEDEEGEEDEEDIMMRGGRKAGRKESLAELLSSDPPWAEKLSSGTASPIRTNPRSVPSSPAPRSLNNPTPPPTSSFRGAVDNNSLSSSSHGGTHTPPVIRASPSLPGNSKFNSLSGQAPPTANRPQPRSPKAIEEDSDSDDELLGRKKRAGGGPMRSADLIAFLDGPPPSSMMRSQPSSSALDAGFDGSTPGKSKKEGRFKGFVSKLTGSSSSSSSKNNNNNNPDGLPPLAPPPSSFNSNSVRSHKGSLNNVNNQQSSSSSVSKFIPSGVRRSRSSSSITTGEGGGRSSNARFIANNSEPLPSSNKDIVPPTPPRMRSKSQTSRDQQYSSSSSSSMPPPPLPTSVTVFPDLPPPRTSATSSNNGNVQVFAPPPSSRGPPRAVIASPPPPSAPPSQQQDRTSQRSAVVAPAVIPPAVRSSSESNPPSRPPRGNRPQPPPRDPVAQSAQTLPTPNNLSVEDPSPSTDVSPALSEAPTFGFPSRLLRNGNGAAGVVGSDEGEVEELAQHEGFSALGLPIQGGEEKRDADRIVHEEKEGTVEESSLLPTPVASPPPIFVKDEIEEGLQPALPISEETNVEPQPQAQDAPNDDGRDLELDDTTSVPPTASTLVAPPTPSTEPSVPHTELLHLRSLLAHASTADEARLLVNSLLSRWGVPYPALPESEVGDVVEERARKREEQVGRVHGWLMEESRGREGEVVEAEEEEKVLAPTVVVDAAEKEDTHAPKQEVVEEEEEEEEFFESPSPQVGQGREEEEEEKEEVVHQHQPVVVAAV